MRKGFHYPQEIIKSDIPELILKKTKQIAVSVSEIILLWD